MWGIHSRESKEGDRILHVLALLLLLFTLFVSISLYILYHLRVPSSKHLSSRTNKRLYCYCFRGSTEEYIVLLLKYSLWTRNDHRCKFILCTFFFLIRICIFSSGEKAALKWASLGSIATHTQAHTHAHACIHKRATVRDCWRNKLLPTPAESPCPLSQGRALLLGLARAWAPLLAWDSSGVRALTAWCAQPFKTWPFWGGEKGEMTLLTRWDFSSPHSSN